EYSLHWRRIMFYQERNTRLRLIIDSKVDRIESRIVELQLLNVDDEIPRPEMHVFRQGYLDRDRREILHDGAPVRVDEIQVQIVFAFIAAEEGDTQCDRA